jgi:hypothetical protein
MSSQEEIMLPTLGSIRKLLEPIYSRLENIESSIKNRAAKPENKKFYRNQDLKSMFGLSSNTIIKYRETGILPYTKIGDIYLYEIKSLEAILIQNKVEL